MEISRRAALATIGGALAMPYVRPSWAKGGSVNVYNWADYIGDTTLADFEAETGIKVVYDTYSSTEDAQAKMLAGSTGYDVVDMAGIVMPLFIKAGVFDKLDQSRLTGWKIDVRSPKENASSELATDAPVAEPVTEVQQ